MNERDDAAKRDRIQELQRKIGQKEAAVEQFHAEAKTVVPMLIALQENGYEALADAFGAEVADKAATVAAAYSLNRMVVDKWRHQAEMLRIELGEEPTGGAK